MAQAAALQRGVDEEVGEEERGALGDRMWAAQVLLEAANRDVEEAAEAKRKVWEEGVREEECVEWRLSGRVVPVVEDYKYLGVRMKSTKRARWSVRREEMMVKAKGAFWRAWGLGLDSAGWVSARGARALWETLLRPVLEYAAEVDSERWEEAERLQMFAGRMCLGVGIIERSQMWWCWGVGLDVGTGAS